MATMRKRDCEGERKNGNEIGKLRCQEREKDRESEMSRARKGERKRK